MNRMNWLSIESQKRYDTVIAFLRDHAVPVHRVNEDVHKIVTGGPLHNGYIYHVSLCNGKITCYGQEMNHE